MAERDKAATEHLAGVRPTAAGARLVVKIGNQHVLAGPAGLLIARPWLDAVTLRTLKHVYFPISRLWAAAAVAHGDRDAFYTAVPLRRRLEDGERVMRALARFEEARAAARAIDAEWESVFFGPTDQSESVRVAIETARLNQRHTFNMTRKHFAFLLTQGVPRLDLQVDAPDVVDAIYAASLTDRRPFVAAPDPMPPVETSRTVMGALGPEQWVRFQSPSSRLGDMVYARVYDPEGVANPPTMILGHGVCVDFDHWHGLIDETRALVAAGIRVIRPEAPWHGRRTPPGSFAGERILGRVPLGALDAFFGAMREWAVLADYARRTSSGPLLIGGTSLGALFAQLASDCAHDWPDRLKPEAMLLITHTGDVAAAMMGGALAEIVGSFDPVAAAGWTPALMSRLMHVIDPVRPPVMAPSRIVSVQGRRDRVTPFGGGEALVKRWGVPSANLFVSEHGHFSIPASLKRNRTSVERFIEIVHSIDR
jgi:pimeloyl-ACP methyl ester carboxylesterase